MFHLIKLFCKIKSLRIIILISFISTAYYNPDDWYVIKKMSSTLSLTEDDFSIHILSNDGIYSIEKSTLNLEYNMDFNHGFTNPKILYYDFFSDFFWLVCKNEIYVRSSVSSNWRTLEYTDLGLNSGHHVFDIGSSPSYLSLIQISEPTSQY